MAFALELAEPGGSRRIFDSSSYLLHMRRAVPVDAKSPECSRFNFFKLFRAFQRLKKMEFVMRNSTTCLFSFFIVLFALSIYAEDPLISEARRLDESRNAETETLRVEYDGKVVKNSDDLWFGLHYPFAAPSLPGIKADSSHNDLFEKYAPTRAENPQNEAGDNGAVPILYSENEVAKCEESRSERWRPQEVRTIDHNDDCSVATVTADECSTKR